MTIAARCKAAHPDDPTPCEGVRDAVRIVDQAGGEMLACVHHGARAYASIDRPRVYPMPGHDGAAIEVYRRAMELPPFPWQHERHPDTEGVEPPQASADNDPVRPAPVEVRLMGTDEAVRVMVALLEAVAHCGPVSYESARDGDTCAALAVTVPVTGHQDGDRP